MRFKGKNKEMETTKLKEDISFWRTLAEVYRNEIDSMRKPPDGCVPGAQCKCCIYAVKNDFSERWAHPTTYICGYGNCKNFILDSDEE